MGVVEFYKGLMGYNFFQSGIAGLFTFCDVTERTARFCFNEWKSAMFMSWEFRFWGCWVYVYDLQGLGKAGIPNKARIRHVAPNPRAGNLNVSGSDTEPVRQSPNR